MALRREAMRAGIQVQLAKLDDPANPLDKIVCVAYRLPRAQLYREGGAWLLYRDNVAGESRTNGWKAAPGSARFAHNYLDKTAPLLAGLSPDIIAFESNPGSVAIYWREQGDSQDVAVIREVLGELVNLTAVADRH